MVNITIDGKAIAAREGDTILTAARRNGIRIPTLCYLEGVNEIGACRVCLVEIEGSEKLSAACNTPVSEGMTIRTGTPRVHEARRMNVAMILSRHDCHCPTCVRNGNCALQSLAGELNLLELPYEKKVPENRWDRSFPLIREESKCIGCLRCASVCDRIQDLGVWTLLGSGSRAHVATSRLTMDESHCSLCGQCITHCPVGALRERDDTGRVFEALRDPEKTVVVQIAPAVRTAWAESLGLTPKQATVGRMTAAVKALGADYVFDTDFSADLTIMEEGSEFVERMTHPDRYRLPMFTSCCPGWVRFMKMEYPELAENLSTAKSPQQMFGAVVKSWFAQKAQIAPEKIFSVSVMPCTAKKYECAVPEVNGAGAGADVDAVLTTRELARMLRQAMINPFTLEEAAFDSPLGTGTGAGVIFGTTGGVMEAALRSAHWLITGKNPDPDAFRAVRGPEGWKEAEIEIAGTKIRAAVASGLGNARSLIEAVKSGKARYDFIEIMACPGGCSGGGGQPIHDGFEMAGERGEILYRLDREAPLRFSHENPDVLALYAEYLEKPLGHKSHELLHTDLAKWTI